MVPTMLGMVVHVFKPGTGVAEADISLQVQAILVYIVKFQASQEYLMRPFLKTTNKRSKQKI